MSIYQKAEKISKITEVTYWKIEKLKLINIVIPYDDNTNLLEVITRTQYTLLTNKY